MERKILLSVCVLMLAASAAEARIQPRLPTTHREARVRPGELLVLDADPRRFRVEADGQLSATESRLAAALERHGLHRGRTIATSRRGARLLKLTSDSPGFDATRAVDDLRRSGAFRAVAPNVVLDPYETVPNDPYLPLQWQVQSIENTDAQLTEAWDVWRGDTSTVIAIIDNGIDISHPDLASQVWINRAEIPSNGIDDDGNGYVDDVKGWDFGDGDDDPSSIPIFDESGIDIGFHGTFVAGIAAAATNNSVGIAGAGWSCRLMPLKIADSNGSMTLQSCGEALLYAADQHAAVVNMSVGTRDTAARDLFQALINEALIANMVCVAGAGNAGSDTLAWPAASDGVIAVGATDELDARASFSNYGPWVDVAAPGAAVYSSICQNYEIDFLSWFFYMLLFGYDGENPYMYADGTSFSSPLVAGICGLIRSKMPSLTPAQVAAHLVATGDPVAYDQPIGPRVNAWRALTQPVALAVGDPDSPASVVSFGDVWPNPFGSTTTMAFTLTRAAPARLAIYDPSGRRVRLLVDATLPAGRHVIRWDGSDGSGRALSAGVYFATLESGSFRGARKLALTR